MFDITDKIRISKKVFFKLGKQIYPKKKDKFQDYLLFEFSQALFLQHFYQNLFTVKTFSP